ncbi:MAG: glycosyltransferase family 1 protein, partial [Acidobacteria bacterium]|nr:glycosyltransferase family 1 protein [Acidobacteriota bacterium]
SVYLLAMGLRKCVIITEGPATRGLLTDEAIIVPQSDPAALADAIRRAWDDDDLRERTANAGRRYAERLQGEARLLADIVNTCGDLVFRKNA